VGLAGINQVLGTVTTGFGSGIDAGIGFDAITVALLGRSKPWGIFAAGILFGAFKAGGFAMQAAEGVPIDIVVVVQALIVLFIAAPPLVRAMFHLPTPGTSRKPKIRAVKTRQTNEVVAK
jgi:simple sugar transport system permease protein